MIVQKFLPLHNTINLRYATWYERKSHERKERDDKKCYEKFKLVNVVFKLNDSIQILALQSSHWLHGALGILFTYRCRWVKAMHADWGPHFIILSRVAIWPFLKLFARNKMVWPFGLFWMLKKIVHLKACFGIIWAKYTILYEILNFNLVILTNFWRKFGLYLAFFIF